MQLLVSLVIPAYNETERLPPYLSSIKEYCDRLFPAAYEVIVVDDGSQDQLPLLIHRLMKGWPQLVCYCQSPNQGKGTAVRAGMLTARGQVVMFADADGATPIEEEAKLRRAIERGADMAVGSRLLSPTHTSRQRTWHRSLLGRLFAWVVRRLVPLPVQDTQCGFKMFRRHVARHLFQLSQEPGYLFDVELLALAHRLGYRIAEVPVSWRDVPGSKVRLVHDGWKMLLGLWALRGSLGKLQQSLPPASDSIPLARSSALGPVQPPHHAFARAAPRPLRTP